MGLTNPGVLRISGSDATYTGTVRITGGPNITVGTDASGLTMSAAAGGAGGVASAGFSTQGNTAGNTSMATSVMQLVGGNNITLSGGTAAGNVTITISGPNAQTAISGVAASNTTYTSGTITITGVGGGITVSSNTGQRIDLSVAAQSVQTQGIESMGVSTGGNTAGNTTVNTGSRMVFAGVGDISLSQATAAGASTISISGSQSVQTQGIESMGVSTGGNTQGNTTVNTGSRMVFVGSNMISLSQGTAAGASTITFNATQSVQTQDVLSAGVSTGGNTAGNTTVNTGSRLVFVGGANITLSQDTAAGATTVNIAGNAGAGAGIASAGFSTQGNTSGNTLMASSIMQLVGGNNVTLSGGTAAGIVTITISVPNTTVQTEFTYSYLDPLVGEQIVPGQQGQGTLHMQPLPEVPTVTFDRMVFPLQVTHATNSTGTLTVSHWLGFYTKNASTLSLYTSFSGTQAMTFSGTASSSAVIGPKNWTAGASGSLPRSDYWAAVVSRTTSGGANATLSQYLLSFQNSAHSGEFGVAPVSSNQYALGLGVYTATTSALPASIAFSQLSGTASIQLRRPKFRLHLGTG